MMQDDVSIQVKVNPHIHGCASRRRRGKFKRATKFWVARESEGLRRIKDEHKVTISYKRVYYGKELALKQLHGDWYESFNNLYRFKAAVEEASPDSFVVIDHEIINEKNRFKRVFFALKACVDGFLNGCRPYLAIDSTFLTGKFRGQLAVACARPRDAIGHTTELSYMHDAGKSIMESVTAVFDDNLWPAAYAWNPYYFEKHWKAMAEAKPASVKYLRDNHNKIWTRSQFSTLSKVDYGHKGMHLDSLLDTLRQKLMAKFHQRRKLGEKMQGKILEHIVKNLAREE
ncbi:hypothetical protein U9M48_029007 [Paspalum notatum var. saurae]|uniref:Transposase n=1 Tax=Paspalum notatum var. saurae TaxID=547442 RepID=A0AAQ3TXZ5_PASNO